MKIFSQGGASVLASRNKNGGRPQGPAREDARPTKMVFAFAAAILFLAVAATAQTTNGFSDAEIQGRQLARKILQQWPANNFTNAGLLNIRDENGKHFEHPIKCETVVTATNWSSIYEKFLPVSASNSVKTLKLVILHDASNSNQYKLTFNVGGDHWTEDNSDAIKLLSFAGDFGCADLGLEFFHWPEQKIIKKEFSRGRGCMVLESTNPNPSPNGYSRVVSWIDEESYGIVHAEAYDANGKLLKVFDPKSFKKVNGQWELQDMEIRNVQTGSRTRIEFDLKSKS
ncbi:MAG TPA: outer membrane lipoprotein-sorting protein [Methylomirabilota bacterium]|nr:outer membrane lipoprotein-sorting protein [Methylomirabilota bacterium]